MRGRLKESKEMGKGDERGRGDPKLGKGETGVTGVRAPSVRETSVGIIWAEEKAA